MNSPKSWAVLCTAMLLLLAGSGPAYALRIGNPAPDIAQGEFGLGATFSDERIGAFAEFGITDAATLQGMVNILETGPNADGTEIGVGYRHKLPNTANVGSKDLRFGILANYSMASIKPEGLGGVGAEFDYSLLQFGFGGALTPVENLNIHGAVIYEQVELEETITVPFFGTLRQPVTDTNLGFSIGAEYWIAPTFLAGIEAHPGLFHNDIAAYGEFKF